MEPEAERRENAQWPGQDATPAGPGAIHGAVSVANRCVPFRARGQPVGLLSVVPSMRMV